ncbi:tryptorubin family RiPP precursor [Streptomyces sp. NPDC014734]|uniref:tryptorubin family RiPP precursor n=1 Tax=Streptomyces sp. NPDC014734 TaxID=3364886 RepID=UPI0036FA0461
MTSGGSSEPPLFCRFLLLVSGRRPPRCGSPVSPRFGRAEKHGIDNVFRVGFHSFRRRRAQNSRSEAGDCRRCSARLAPSVVQIKGKDGGVDLKFLFSLKDKLTPEKSLKAYAWYHWY